MIRFFAIAAAVLLLGACNDEPEPGADARPGLLRADDLSAKPTATNTPGLPADGSPAVGCAGVEGNALLDAGYDFSLVRFDGVGEDSVESVLFKPPADDADLDTALDDVRGAFEECLQGLGADHRTLVDEIEIEPGVFAYESRRTDGSVETRRGYQVADGVIVAVTVMGFEGAEPAIGLATLLDKAVSRAEGD